MTVEELFRDDKNKRNGWSLRHTRITKAELLDRLLLILALAYWLLVGLGHMARQRYQPAMWSSSNRQKECSVFPIGRIIRDRLELTPTQAVAAVLEAIVEASRKWG